MGKLKWFYYGVLSLALITSVAACNAKFSPDPLEDQSEDVRNGIPPFTKVTKPDVIPSRDLLFIERPSEIVYYEGVQQEIAISGRSMFPGYSYRLYVLNASDFRDAKISVIDGYKKKDDKVDETKETVLRFDWTPPRDDVERREERVFNLKVRLALLTPDEQGVINSRDEVVPVRVRRVLGKPSITGNDLPDYVRETEQKDFTIYFSDADSFDSEGVRPTVQFLPLEDEYKINLFPFVSLGEISFDSSRKQWAIEGSVDLRMVELTGDTDTGVFGVRAISQFNMISDVQEVVIEVRTKARTPLSTWKSTADFTAGVRSSHTFEVYSPPFDENTLRYDNSQLAVSFITQCATIPGSPTCTCIQNRATLTMQCTINWLVPCSFARSSYSFEYSAKTTSPVDSRDTESNRFRGDIAISGYAGPQCVPATPNPPGQNPEPGGGESDKPVSDEKPPFDLG